MDDPGLFLELYHQEFLAWSPVLIVEPGRWDFTLQSSQLPTVGVVTQALHSAAPQAGTLDPGHQAAPDCGCVFILEGA